MKICSNCGASFEDEAMFCTECGSPLNENGAKEVESFVVDDEDEEMGTSILDDEDEEMGTSILDDEEPEFEVEDVAEVETEAVEEAEAESDEDESVDEVESEEIDFDVDDEAEEEKVAVEDEREIEEEVQQTEYFDDPEEVEIEENESFEVEVEEEKPEPKPEVRSELVVEKKADKVVEKKTEAVKSAVDTKEEKPKKKKGKAGIVVGAIILVIVVVIGALFAIRPTRHMILSQLPFDIQVAIGYAEYDDNAEVENDSVVTSVQILDAVSDELNVSNVSVSQNGFRYDYEDGTFISMDGLCIVGTCSFNEDYGEFEFTGFGGSIYNAEGEECTNNFSFWADPEVSQFAIEIDETNILPGIYTAEIWCFDSEDYTYSFAITFAV